jgi:hypothetical protein
MQKSTPLKTKILTRYELEHFKPSPRSILLAISDSPNDRAHVDLSQWDKVYFHSFVDAGYDEESIATFGRDFDRVYADYISPEKVSDLRSDLNLIMADSPELLVIESEGGKGRTQAIAQYLRDGFGSIVEQEIGEANQTVLRLLNNDISLLRVIASARSGELDEQNDLNFDAEETPTTLISKLLNFFGVEQKPRH